MKYLLIPFLIFIAACRSGTQGGSTTTDTKLATDTGESAGTGNPNTSTGKGGTNVLFVGEFATLHDTGGNNFDGLYDSTQSLFSFCGTNKVEHVNSTEISYDEFASCDTTKRVMLIMKDSAGRLNPNGVSLKVVGNHAEVIGDPSRVIQLSPAAMKRINAAKVNRRQPADGKSTPSNLVPQQPLKDNQMIIDSSKLMRVTQPKQQPVNPLKMNPAMQQNHLVKPEIKR